MAILENIKKRMTEVQKMKAEDLAQISKVQLDASEKITAAETAMREASAKMDPGAYEKAQGEKNTARIAWEMAAERRRQLQYQEYITEEESDRAIDDLLAYEVKITEDFKKATAAPLRELARLYDEYMEKIGDVEGTLSAWQDNVHANYRSRGGTMYYDETSGSYTDKASDPVRVKSPLSHGCEESHTLKRYLEKAEALYREE